MTTHILMACSKSKSKPPENGLYWGAKRTLRHWKKSWDDAENRISVEELYTGRQFRTQLSICRKIIDGQIFVISAGAGLVEVKKNNNIPSYEATFSTNLGPTLDEWPLLPEGGLENLSAKAGDQIVTFCPPQYHRALANDPLIDEFAPLFVVVSTSPLASQAGTVINIHPRTKEVLNVASNDLNSELFRVFLNDGQVGMQQIYDLATNLPPPQTRRKVDDAELLELILGGPKEIQNSIARTVQYIRHTCGVSAIDTRIRRLLLESRNY